MFKFSKDIQCSHDCFEGDLHGSAERVWFHDCIMILDLTIFLPKCSMKLTLKSKRIPYSSLGAIKNFMLPFLLHFDYSKFGVYALVVLR